MLVSGDLTDARGGGIFKNGQNEEEWRTYDEILTTSHVRTKTIWLDIPGNHGKEINRKIIFILSQN